MKRRRVVLCGGASDDGLPFDDRSPIRFGIGGHKPNVHLSIQDITWRLLRNIPDRFSDLIEIATYVYCADQAFKRDTGISSVGEDWRREIFLRVPVRDPAFWRSEEMQLALVPALNFVTDDEYSFEFVKAGADGPSEQQSLLLSDDHVDEVLLFSGGMDSLGGAIQEAVVDGKRVALVSHRSNPKSGSQQDRLSAELSAYCKHMPLHVAVRMNKGKTIGRDPTQRSRSFLYVAIAGAIADMLGLHRLRFYENGVVSLNLPLSAQVVGAKATRTTHPKTLHGFATILSLVADRTFAVENPFFTKTRAEVVALIVEAKCGALIRQSVSCVHTMQITKTHPHCGSCSQCIGRRFAVMAAGAEQYEPGGPEEMYRVNLLTGERPPNESKTMVASFVESASQMERMSFPQFLSRYGEVTRALRYVDGSPDVAAMQIFELHQRHARDVAGVVERALQRHSREIRLRSLPESCLIRLVCDSGLGAVQQVLSLDGKQTTGPNVFRKSGRAWEVRFRGGPRITLLPTKGAAFLHMLISNPGVAIPASRMICLIAKEPQTYQLGDAGDRVDRQAIAAYHAEYKRLQGEMREAEEQSDSAAIATIQEAMGWILDAIKESRGLGGRMRKEKDDANRARNVVFTRVRDVLKEIHESDPLLAAHLRPPVLTRGFTPCYDPGEDAIDWQT